MLSQILPYCPTCIREHFHKLAPRLMKLHARTRTAHNLSPSIPNNSSGKTCTLCVNGCRICAHEYGYCGVRKNINGKIIGPDAKWAYCDWYHDSLPTNCVADWICLGHVDYGYKNLAVFYEGCTYNCLFCQNWHFHCSPILSAVFFHIAGGVHLLPDLHSRHACRTQLGRGVQFAGIHVWLSFRAGKYTSVCV